MRPGAPLRRAVSPAPITGRGLSRQSAHPFLLTHRDQLVRRKDWATRNRPRPGFPSLSPGRFSFPAPHVENFLAIVMAQDSLLLYARRELTRRITNAHQAVAFAPATRTGIRWLRRGRRLFFFFGAHDGKLFRCSILCHRTGDPTFTPSAWASANAVFRSTRVRTPRSTNVAARQATGLLPTYTPGSGRLHTKKLQSQRHEESRGRDIAAAMPGGDRLSLRIVCRFGKLSCAAFPALHCPPSLVISRLPNGPRRHYGLPRFPGNRSAAPVMLLTASRVSPLTIASTARPSGVMDRDAVVGERRALQRHRRQRQRCATRRGAAVALVTWSIMTQICGATAKSQWPPI